LNKWKVAIVFIILAAAGLLYAQNRATAVSTVSISKEEIESFFSILPPEQLRSLAAQPEPKKQFVDRLKEMFSLSLEAERLGLDSKPEAQSDLKLLEKVLLATVFRERKGTEQPQALEITDADKAEFYKSNPGAFDQFMNENPRFKSAPPEQAEKLKSELAELFILNDRAKRAGIDKDKGYQMLYKVQRASYLAGRTQQELRTTTVVGDPEMKKHYDENKQQFEETRASHILIMLPEQREQRAQGEEKKEGQPAQPAKPATKEDARKLAEQLLARVKAGEDFAKLAKEYSDDTGSGQQGGDLGFFRKDVRFVPEFKEAVFKLKPGEVSDIVETQFGYHIIKVIENRTAGFDEAMKAELKDDLLEKEIQKRIEAIKAKDLVKIDENFTMPAPPPEPPAPAVPQGQTPQGQTPQGQQPAQPGALPDDGHGHGATNPHGMPKHGTPK
jgi:parvulin-like peptidyl-prolyl isomerase